MRDRTARTGWQRTGQSRWREYTIDDINGCEAAPRGDDGTEGDRLRCPYCGSRHLQAVTRGFHAGRAAGCGCLTGSWLVALLAGGLGAGRTEFVCMDCGRRSRLDEGRGGGGCCALFLLAAVIAVVVLLLT